MVTPFFLTYFKAPTKTTNRECKHLTVCNSTSFEATPPKKDADRTCETMTVCKNYGEDGGEYESKANTKNRDRECTKIKVCDDETEYESREPTARLDRICNKLTTCKDKEWEEGPPEPAMDRLCTPLTVCDDNHATDSKTEWEKVAPDEYTDRECEKVTVCGAAQYVEESFKIFSVAKYVGIPTLINEQFRTET